ncbi:MAG: sporulation protein [Clostridia bacterium]|nr:sporulation protein [Clostridia bacterium]
MSFFDKAFASIGIGSAKVNTVVNNKTVRVGDEVQGYVTIIGGKIEQQIDKIYIDLETYYIRENDDGQRVRYNVRIQRVDIFDSFMLAPKETKEIPFSFTIPNETPISLGKDNVWLQTGLDIKMAIDPSDKDYLQIMPHPYVDCFVDALTNELGFRLVQCENEYAPRLGGNLPFVQEFEFRPTTHFRGDLDELELVFFVNHGSLEVLMEIDRKARGLRGFLLEAADMDESYIRLTIPASVFEDGVGAVAECISDTISRYI